MSRPLPGQRAAQRPMRAAMSSQRAVGRAVNAQGSVSTTLIMNVGGRWFRVGVDERGREHLNPCDTP